MNHFKVDSDLKIDETVCKKAEFMWARGTQGLPQKGLGSYSKHINIEKLLLSTLEQNSTRPNLPARVLFPWHTRPNLPVRVLPWHTRPNLPVRVLFPWHTRPNLPVRVLFPWHTRPNLPVRVLLPWHALITDLAYLSEFISLGIHSYTRLS